MQSYDVEPEEDDMAIGVARRKKGPVPKLLNNERCKGMFFRIIEAMWCADYMNFWYVYYQRALHL